jgi:hypothetical protein
VEITAEVPIGESFYELHEVDKSVRGALKKVRQCVSLATYRRRQPCQFAAYAKSAW